MQSVALLDSVVVPNDDEWIVLHPTSPSASLDTSQDQVLGDDNSYDYCEDVYSVFSSEGLDYQPIRDSLGETIHPPATIHDESVLEESVDESSAHHDDPTRRFETLSHQVRDHSISLQGHHYVGGLDDDEESVVALTAVDSKTLEDSLGHGGGANDDLSVASSAFTSGRYSFAGDEAKFSEDSSKMDLFADGFEPTQRARLSNKKRRKQLRLTKKATATAAAAAAVAAASAAISHIHLNASPKKPHHKTNRKQVGIALQAIESYKQEVIRSTGKNKNLAR